MIRDLTGGLGVDVGDRGGGIGARRRGGAESDPRRRTLRDRRPLHRRRPERDQRARADQPQASRDPRLLGQRGRPLRPRAARARAASRRRSRGARSARRPTRSPNSIRRSPTPRRCVSRKRLSAPLIAARSSAHRSSCALGFRLVSAAVALLVNVAFPLYQREQFTVFGSTSPFWDTLRALRQRLLTRHRVGRLRAAGRAAAATSPTFRSIRC